MAEGQGAASSVPGRYQTHLLGLFTLGSVTPPPHRRRPLVSISCWPGTGHIPHCLKISGKTFLKVAPVKSHPTGSIGLSS